MSENPTIERISELDFLETIYEFEDELAQNRLDHITYSSITAMQTDETLNPGDTAIINGAIYDTLEVTEVKNETDMTNPDIIYLYNDTYYKGNSGEEAIGFVSENGFIVVSNKNNFVTPEMYGAIGDGVNDDSDALYEAMNNNNLIMGVSSHTYYVEQQLDVNGKTFINCHFKFPSHEELTGVLRGTNAKFILCTFESTNDKSPGWGQGTGLFSNDIISARNTRFIRCTFKQLEHVSTGNLFNYPNSEFMTFDNCEWFDCASGVTGNYSNNVKINNCEFNLLDYTNALCHAIYCSNDCKYWYIDDVRIDGCKNFPLSIDNEHDYGQNPEHVYINNVVITDCDEVIVSTAKDLHINNLHIPDTPTGRFFLGGGDVHISNSDIKGRYLFHVPDNDAFPNGVVFYNEITLDNCEIETAGLVIYPQRILTNKGSTNINSNSCDWKVAKFSDSRSVKWKSKNDTHEITGNYWFDNVDVASEAPASNSFFDVELHNDIIHMVNSVLVNSYGGNFKLRNVDINSETNQPIFTTRDDDKSTITFDFNGVVFNSKWGWIARNTDGSKVSITNDSNFDVWKTAAEESNLANIPDIDLTGCDKFRMALTSSGVPCTGWAEFDDVTSQARIGIYNNDEYHIAVRFMNDDGVLTSPTVTATGWTNNSFGIIVQTYKN